MTSSTPVSWNLAARRPQQKGSTCHGCEHYKSEQGCLLKGRHSPDARITIVIESPGPVSVNHEYAMHASDEHAKILNALISQVGGRVGDQFLYNVIYLVGHVSRGAPKKGVVDACWPYVRKKLYDHRKQYEGRYGSSGLHVVIPMGATASRAIVKGKLKMNEMRGKRYERNLDGYEWIVMPTLGVSNISVTPGVARVVVDDLVHALQLSRMNTLPERRTIEDISKDYIIPQTLEEVKEVCDLIINYTNSTKQPDPGLWPISVDTETNTLYPFSENARILMVSFAWDEGKATAITLDHPEVPYDPAEAWKHVRRVLASPKPKIFHNAKFDWQMLTYVGGAPVTNLWWDTMLAEHFLDEDKKGFYSLKVVTGKYARAYSGYEDKLKDALKSDRRVLEACGVPRGQSEPDPTKSWVLSGFYPSVDYSPACEQPEAADLSEADRRELFTLEREYLDAHLQEDSKTKTSRRGMIKRRVDNYGLDMPDFARDIDFSPEQAGGFEHVPLPVLQSYAGADADVTRIICRMQRNRTGNLSQDMLDSLFHDLLTVMRDLYIPGTLTLGKMEYEGTRVDDALIRRYEDELLSVETDYLQKLKTLTAQQDFNPNSSNELAKIIGTVIPVEREDLEFTAKGALAVRKDWLSAMATKDRYFDTPTGDFFEALLIYRAAQKARGTFLAGIRDLSKYDGNIHTSFLLNGTSTGRLSSRGPNLQNIPLWLGRYERGDKVIVPGWNIKQLFRTSDDDHVFFQLDIQAAEIRVLCAYAQDEKLIQALKEGLDIHSFIASHIFDPTYDEFMAGKDSNPTLKLLRTAAKRVVFGTLYGAGPFKIAQQIYGTLSTDEAEKQEQIQFAQNTINLLFERFPTIRTYVEGTKQEVREAGKVRTFFGRYRRFGFQANSYSDYKMRLAAEREAVNFKIQSTSSDLVLSQLIEVAENIRDIDARVSLTVHDSIAGEIRRDSLRKMRAFFDHYIEERVQEKFPWMPVTFQYDLEIGPSYGELAPFEAYELLEVPQAQWTEKEAKMMKKALPVLEKAGIFLSTQEEVASV